MGFKPIGKYNDDVHQTHYWKVNGTKIPIPQEVKIEHTNVADSDSGRNEKGVMKITWLRRDVKKVSMKWNALTGNEVEAIVNLMQGKEYTFSYYDNGAKSFSGYTGDSDYSIYAYHPNIYGDQGGLYTDFSIDAVEL